jgi:hypothetical protein
MKLFGVVVSCSKGCEHLIAADKDYYKAWGQAYPYGALDDAKTIRIGANAKAVRELGLRTSYRLRQELGILH